MTDQEIYEAYNPQKEYDAMLQEEMLHEKQIYERLMLVMKPSKHTRLLGDLDVFSEQSSYFTLVELSTKVPREKFWTDKDIPFKGFSSRLDETVGCMACCDCCSGTLWLRVTKSLWLEIQWSL